MNTIQSKSKRKSTQFVSTSSTEISQESERHHDDMANDSDFSDDWEEEVTKYIPKNYTRLTLDSSNEPHWTTSEQYNDQKKLILFRVPIGITVEQFSRDVDAKAVAKWITKKRKHASKEKLCDIALKFELVPAGSNVAQEMESVYTLIHDPNNRQEDSFVVRKFDHHFAVLSKSIAPIEDLYNVSESVRTTLYVPREHPQEIEKYRSVFNPIGVQGLERSSGTSSAKRKGEETESLSFKKIKKESKYHEDAHSGNSRVNEEDDATADASLADIGQFSSAESKKHKKAKKHDQKEKRAKKSKRSG